MTVDALHVAPVILDVLFELLDRVTLRRRQRIAELDQEPRTFEAMPVCRPRAHSLRA